MPQSYEKLMGVCAEISSSIGKITLKNQHDFEQVNSFESPVKTGLFDCYFSR